MYRVDDCRRYRYRLALGLHERASRRGAIRRMNMPDRSIRGYANHAIAKPDFARAVRPEFVQTSTAKDRSDPRRSAPARIRLRRSRNNTTATKRNVRDATRRRTKKPPSRRHRQSANRPRRARRGDASRAGVGAARIAHPTRRNRGRNRGLATKNRRFYEENRGCLLATGARRYMRRLQSWHAHAIQRRAPARN